MRWLLLFSLISGLVLGGIAYYQQHYLPSGLYLNQQSLSGWKRSKVLPYLARLSNQAVRIRVNNRTYRFFYRDLGVIVDINQTYRALLATKWFAPKTVVRPKLIFAPAFYERVRSLTFDFSQTQDRIVLDPRHKNLLYENNQQSFQIDPDSLAKELVQGFGQNAVLAPRVNRIFDKRAHLKIDDYNERLGQVMANPVNLHLGVPEISTVTLDPVALHQLVEVNYQPREEWLQVGVDEEALQTWVRQKAWAQPDKSDWGIDSVELRQKLLALINARFNGQTANDVNLTLVESANTHGEIAAKYIEVDISQQRMYLFENEQIKATYRISSGLYYPTPPGRYQILNKAINAYSDIYHVWMPYWMAFSLDKKVNAYLGIHELPYWVDNSGQTIRRPRDFIGSPHTGGCVSLDVGEAQQVYNWADVGTPVVIYS